VLDYLQYQILKKIAPGDPQTMNGSAYDGKSKIGVYLGDGLLDLVRDKIVIDFGCGEGAASLDLARCGAKKVFGIDIRQGALDRAASKAAAEGLAELCEFLTSTDTKADVIVSLDAFEHFEDPGAILEILHGLLKPGGCVMLCFGPTWYHPLGGHLFSVFPWAHLVFSEAALVRWRSTIRSDGATRFSEVEGGLNQMTIARFERLAAASKFHLVEMETVPIRPLRSVHSRLTREFTTAIVRAKLMAKEQSA
jgi:SAM-dependent methyltransferase